MLYDDEIKDAFQKYLGIAFDEMEEIDTLIYAPDYLIFKAGWDACRNRMIHEEV